MPKTTLRDYGHSLTQSPAPRLDPLPYRGIYPWTTTRNAVPFVSEDGVIRSEFAPRGIYSQNREDYDK